MIHGNACFAYFNKIRGISPNSGIRIEIGEMVVVHTSLSLARLASRTDPEI